MLDHRCSVSESRWGSHGIKKGLNTPVHVLILALLIILIYPFFESRGQLGLWTCLTAVVVGCGCWALLSGIVSRPALAGTHAHQLVLLPLLHGVRLIPGYPFCPVNASHHHQC